jgi:hypothetical protein
MFRGAIHPFSLEHGSCSLSYRAEIDRLADALTRVLTGHIDLNRTRYGLATGISLAWRAPKVGLAEQREVPGGVLTRSTAWEE